MNTARIPLVNVPHMPAGWALAALLLGVFAVHAPTARSIVAIWSSSETYAHGYIILPISLWLVWRRRQELKRIAAQPFWPALPLIVACGFGWLLAELGEVQVIRQYAFVALLPLSVLAVAGLPLARAMAFPLFFLLLAVPFGEAFVAPLIDFTADFTVAALQLTGIPVLRNGSNFEIPSGSWSVVEACSGVRYLISSFTLGCLYAYLNYRSPTRRAMFVLLSIIVPIVANGLRAYMIVMIGHLSDNRLAAGVDHLIYGWVFFGLVMFLMFWVGSYWREDLQREAGAVPASAAPGTVAERPAFLIAAVLAMASVAIWPAYARFAERIGTAGDGADLTRIAPDWRRVAPFAGWKHGFSPAQQEVKLFFEQGTSRVGISVLLYRGRKDGAGLISTANRLVADQDRGWQQVSSTVQTVSMSGRTLDVRESRIQGDGKKLLVWQWYAINGTATANDYLGKILLAKERLLMRSDEGAAILLFAPYAENAEDARASMRHFLADHFVPLGTALVPAPRDVRAAARPPA